MRLHFPFAPPNCAEVSTATHADLLSANSGLNPARSASRPTALATPLSRRHQELSMPRTLDTKNFTHTKRSIDRTPLLTSTPPHSGEYDRKARARPNGDRLPLAF